MLRGFITLGRGRAGRCVIALLACWPGVRHAHTPQVADGVIEVLASTRPTRSCRASPSRSPGPTPASRRTRDRRHRRPPALALPPGTYTVKVELSGFHGGHPGGADAARRPDREARRHAQGGAGGRDGHRHGEAPLVDVFKTDSSTNIVPEQIQALPVADRDFQHLAFLARACSASAAASASSTTARSSAPAATPASRRSSSTASTSPTRRSAWPAPRFSQDAIREFRVITNRFDTEIGGSAGGALSIVTKSGTNELSGLGLRLLPRRRAARQGRARAAEEPATRASSSASRSAARSSRTGRTTSLSLRADRAKTTSRSSARGGIFTSQAADLPVPVRPVARLRRARPPHQRQAEPARPSSSTSATARRTSAWAASATSRTGSSSTATTGTSPSTHSWTDQQLVAQRARVPGRPAASTTSRPTRRADGVVLVGQHAETGAQHRRRPSTRATSVEIRDTFFTRIGGGKWATTSRPAARGSGVKRPLELPGLPAAA